VSNNSIADMLPQISLEGVGAAVLK
jgi:hypothetical protein